MPEATSKPAPFIYRPELIASVREQTRPMYFSPDVLEYHNTSHIDDTFREADRLIKMCEANGELVDRETIELALAIHDILYPVPTFVHPDLSKEDFSALFGRELLENLNLDEAKIDNVLACVKFTEAGTHLSDFEVEGQLDESLRTCLVITRRADIENLQRNRVVFLSNSLKLYKESRTIHSWYGTEPSGWSAFVLKQQEFLNMLLDDDLSLGAERNQGSTCEFTRKAMRNTALLSTEAVTNFQSFVSKYGKQILSYVPGLREFIQDQEAT